MSIHTVLQAEFGFFPSLPVVVEASAAQLSGDAGLLPIRQFDEQIGLTRQFAAALFDPRDQTSVDHSYEEMVRTRVYGILADYEDQNDHDTLRHDPVFKLLAGRSPNDPALASQPTLSRFENGIDVASLFRLRDVLIDRFIASFTTPPGRLTFDVDTFDDPAHGQQQLTFYHGYYEQYQYQPRAITCADNDLVVMITLLFGTAKAGLGFIEDLEYLVDRLRAVWPHLDIELRADSGFGDPLLYDACERLRVCYSIGMRMNAVFKRHSEDLLKQAVQDYEKTGQKQRLFLCFEYRARTWSRARFTIIKCEAGPEGTNRRVIVTNRRGTGVLPGACYDEYANRGESENRNKELKRGLKSDRLSDHRYMANLFRLYLHVTAMSLLVLMRRLVVDPTLPQLAAELGGLPAEALPEPTRRQYFNRRRRRDPLGEGHIATWQTRLIKVAAEIVVSARRVLVRLASGWPYLHHFQQVADAVRRFCSPPRTAGYVATEFAATESG